MSFFSRLRLALRFLFGGELPQPPPPALPSPVPTLALSLERQHASGLFLLGLLQREGRLLDFLQEDVAGFSDAEVGAAARVVHEGCRKVLHQYVPLTPVVPQNEGAAMEVPSGFDANRFRLTGNVAGAGPWKGALKHHGWVVSKLALPEVPTTVDVAVLAPAEVELS
jgi:Domain of unknown function (DUF2760)